MKFIPKLLHFEQKQLRIKIAQEILDSVRDNPNLLQRVITGDESWVYGYYVETKAQSSQCKLLHEPRPKLKKELNKIIKNDFLKCFEDWKKQNRQNYLFIHEKINNF